ncbi:MAG: hypothetical protein KDA68_02375 [Planctomycetaceae bacterium]|nr:hypothetical protein [Planctomycetaceae bacterium]
MESRALPAASPLLVNLHLYQGYNHDYLTEVAGEPSITRDSVEYGNPNHQPVEYVTAGTKEYSFPVNHSGVYGWDGDPWSITAENLVSITVEEERVIVNQTLDLNYSGPIGSPDGGLFRWASYLGSKYQISVYSANGNDTPFLVEAKLSIDRSDVGAMITESSDSFPFYYTSMIMSQDRYDDLGSRIGDTIYVFDSKRTEYHIPNSAPPQYGKKGSAEYSAQGSVKELSTHLDIPNGELYNPTGTYLNGGLFLHTPYFNTGTGTWSGHGRITSTAEFTFRVNQPPPEIEFVTSEDGQTDPDPNGPATNFVRMGIWNNAYTETGEIKNGTAEIDNFIGSDQRRFYVRVTDHSANTDPSAKDTILVDLKVFDGNNGKIREKRRNYSITLEETGVDTGVFVSRGLMLVASKSDADVPTNTGFDDSVATRGARDHRLRLAKLDDIVEVTYDSKTSQSKATKTATVFKRGAGTDERRTLPFTSYYYFLWNDKNGNGTYDSPKEELNRNYYKHAAKILAKQVEKANELWAQVGLNVRMKGSLQKIPYSQPVNAEGTDFPEDYFFNAKRGNDPERTKLINHLLSNTTFAENSLGVIMVNMRETGNGQANLLSKGQLEDHGQGNSSFVFVNQFSTEVTTLAHELFHVLYNKEDAVGWVPDPHYFTYNTKPVKENGPQQTRIHADTADWFRLEPTDPFFGGKNLREKTDGTGNFIVRDYEPSRENKKR